MSAEDRSTWPVLPVDELKRFIVSAMCSAGTCEEHAAALAEVVAAADMRGHHSHGVNRLPMYVEDVSSGACRGVGTPTVITERAASALVDGNNLLGPVVANFAMDLAVSKAREAGVGWVSVKGSNHFGIASAYSSRASRHGMMGMAFTNSSPIQVPTRGSEAVFGTNPISVAAPSDGVAPDFLLDMATSTVAWGKVEMAQVEGWPSMPQGWAVDTEGRETLDPQKGRAVLPLGGTESSSGFKGYGLALMVDIFCGVLAGAAYGPHVRRWMETGGDANLGHCFVAVDPTAFAPGFGERVADLLTRCKTSRLAEGEKEILVAGEPESRSEAAVRERGGVIFHPNQLNNMTELANKLGVAPPKVKGHQ